MTPDNSEITNTFITGLAIGAVVMTILALIVATPDWKWKQEAVRHDAAHYVTLPDGSVEWQWKNKAVEAKP